MDGKTLVELRMRGGPMATLINGHKIGGEEMMAIMDIELAIDAMQLSDNPAVAGSKYRRFSVPHWRKII